MDLQTADFLFTTGRREKSKAVEVSFRPGEVVVTVDGKEIWKADNSKGKIWKPCVTHCEEIYRLAVEKPPDTQHAKNRAKDLKPKLQLYKKG